MLQSHIRVCHIVSGDGWGGAERVVSLLLAGMSTCSELRISVVLFNHGQLASILDDHGIETHVISENGRSFLDLCRELRSWFSKREFDVIHVHRYKELAAAMLALAPRIPNLVVTVHGLQPWSQVGLFEGGKYWGFMLVARLFRTSFVAVSSEIERRLCRVLGRSKTTHIPNPIPDVSKQEKVCDLRAMLGWLPTTKVVGFVGRLEFVKGPDLFLQIASMCSGEVGFVIIGGGAMEKDLKASVQVGGLKERVHFVGQVRDATSFISQLDVLALTSRHEGLPMVLLEAASCEIPVVAFDVGGVREVADGGAAARLVRFGDLHGFVQAIQDVMGAPMVVRRGILSWTNSVRSKFSSQAVVKAYSGLYQRATGRRFESN